MSYSMSLNLQQKASQSLKQTQRLIMSPQMQQAIQLLQMPVMELSQVVEAEMEHNPILEYELPDQSKIEDEIEEAYLDGEFLAEEEMVFDEKDYEVLHRLDEDFSEHFAQSSNLSLKRNADEEKLRSFMESSIQRQSTLFEHLMKQARESFDKPREIDLAEFIIGNFDERGFLEMPLEEIALLYDAPVEELQELLSEIQSFEPVGVGASDVRECLLIQLIKQGKRHTTAYQIIEIHYQDLLYNRIPQIKKSLQISTEFIRQAIDEDIAPLDLYPGTSFTSEVVPFIKADAFIEKRGNQLVVKVDEETPPPIRINHQYLKMIKEDKLSNEVKDYIKTKIASGKWLLRNIHQRNDTLYRIVEYLSREQKQFFEKSEGALLPMTMKTLAEELQLHESTIARAVANKYLDCPRGLLPLRSFFTNAYITEEGDVSSTTVKDMLKKMIEKEDKHRPLSDETLSNLIKENGVPCARRTVAKYRRELNIGNSSQRKIYS